MPAIQTVTLSFFRFNTLAGRLWAFSMMGRAKGPLARVPDLEFWKLCGSGGGSGFRARILGIDVYAILCVWPDMDTAKARLGAENIFNRYRSQADEDWTVFLAPISSRGAWSGQQPFDADGAEVKGPLAALTRATLTARNLSAFWKRVPTLDKLIGQDPNVAFKIGIGELPLVQQITFSIWPNTETMAAFARDRNGPHAKAIAAVRDGQWFREELYARFRILGETGTWNGESPLKAVGL